MAAQRKNRYDTAHLKNLSLYERQIAEIYKEAVRETALIGTSVPNVDADRVFSFADYPITSRRINALLDTLQRNVLSVIVNGINAEWALSNEKNDELVNSALGQAVRGLTAEQRRQYFSNNDSALQAFSERKVNGMNLSDRVWKYTDQFKSEIELGIDIGLREGRSAQQLSQDLRGYLQHPDKLFRRVRDEHGQLVLSKRAAVYHPGQGIYRSSYKNAIRMTGTETNMAYRTADHTRWQQLDFVVGQEIHTSNNHTLNGKKFEDMCDELEGKYPKDFEFTGWHPNCRCYATSILKSREEMREDNRRIMNGEEPLPAKDSVNYVPSVPKGFTDWVVANKDRIAKAKSMPYFIKDNQKVVDEILQGRLMTEGKEPTLRERADAISFNPTRGKHLSFDELKKEYWVIAGSEEKYNNGLPSKFDFDGAKKDLILITNLYGINLNNYSMQIVNENIFSVTWGGDGFQLSRTFYIDRNTNKILVDHALFKLAEEYQGKGLSKDVFRVLYAKYQDMGVSGINVLANIDVGGYTWARYGFCASESNVRQAIRMSTANDVLKDKARQIVDDFYKKGGNASKLFPMNIIVEKLGTDDAKAVLLGTHWDGSIDLTDKQQRAVFEKYLGV